MKCVLGGGEVLAHVSRLYGARALGAIEGYTPLYCSGPFTEVYLLEAQLVGAVETIIESGRVPYFAGVYAGRLRTARPRFIPSHILIERIYKYLGHPIRAFKALEPGVRVVLYGRDLLAESVDSCYEPVEAGEVVSVVGLDGYVYALGLSKVSSCGEMSKLKKADAVAQIIFDLGWYLRGGTAPREAKYRV